MAKSKGFLKYLVNPCLRFARDFASFERRSSRFSYPSDTSGRGLRGRLNNLAMYR